MRLNNATMYARVLASDASCNGRFFTGVLTTGIYCLPSCKARKPRPENVRFFPTCEAARAASQVGKKRTFFTFGFRAWQEGRQ
jgi:AraC family transcriptional regulator of adaptative response / DNA-3-methyladenine glycosylase II